jgi:hypothetical protein
MMTDPARRDVSIIPNVNYPGIDRDQRAARPVAD